MTFLSFGMKASFLLKSHYHISFALFVGMKVYIVLISLALSIPKRWRVKSLVLSRDLLCQIMNAINY